MSGPIYSDDGYWMWNGTEWIPATQAQNIIPAQQIDQTSVNNVAAEVGVHANEVAAVATHFDLNKDGVIDQNEMMQAAQSIANPVNIPAPGMGNVPNNLAVPNANVFTASHKKGFNWKEQKKLLIGGITTTIVAIGVLLFFLLSGNAIVGTWVNDTGEITFNKDGTFQSEEEGVKTWETTDDNKLIQTITNTLPNGSKMTTIITSQYELSDGNNVLWMNITSMVNQDGENMLIFTDLQGNEIEITMPCTVALRDSIAINSAEYNSTIASYQSSKPSWC